MRNCLNYVLGEEKTDETLMYVDGPYEYDTVTPENVYQSFIGEKKLWGKEDGRQCAHYEVAFHRDEDITPEEVYEFGRELFQKMFNGYQFVMAVHKDKDHLHAHAVVNTVSYEDGRKLHVTKGELEQFKQLCNRMCRERGLHVARKGYHLDGSRMGGREFTSWNKNSYNQLVKHHKSSHKYRCIRDIEASINLSASREEFIRRMNEKGWKVRWTEGRKYITFENESGFKIRNITISKELHKDLSKEALENGFRYIRDREQGRDDYGREQFDSIRGTSQYEYDDGNEIGEWFAQGGPSEVISEVLNVGRRVERAVSGDAQGVGRGDATDPTVMSKYRERKRDSEDESEEQYQGIQM